MVQAITLAGGGAGGAIQRHSRMHIHQGAHTADRTKGEGYNSPIHAWATAAPIWSAGPTLEDASMWDGPGAMGMA